MENIRNIKSLEDLRKAIQENTKIGDAIRLKCLDCCGYEWNEVLECNITDCPLHLFRKGKNPFTKRTLTQEQKEKQAERLKQARQNKVAEPIK